MLSIAFAFASAVFAALTSILAKIGIEGINSNLATAIRTFVVLVMSWGMVFVTGTQGGITDLTTRNWTFLILSGLATGASWLCYFKALQIGVVSQVVAIDKFSIVLTILMAAFILNEGLSLKMVIGTTLITAGTFVMIL
jgi:transporter family protein